MAHSTQSVYHWPLFQEKVSSPLQGQDWIPRASAELHKGKCSVFFLFSCKTPCIGDIQEGKRAFIWHMFRETHMSLLKFQWQRRIIALYTVWELKKIVFSFNVVFLFYKFPNVEEGANLGWRRRRGKEGSRDHGDTAPKHWSSCRSNLQERCWGLFLSLPEDSLRSDMRG